MKLKIGLIVLAVFVASPLVCANESVDQDAVGLLHDDPCAVWVSHAKSIVDAINLYKEYQIDYRSNVEEYMELEDYEPGSAGRILLTDTIDNASAGVPKEQVLKGTLNKCRQLDPEWVKDENANLAMPRSVNVGDN